MTTEKELSFSSVAWPIKRVIHRRVSALVETVLVENMNGKGQRVRLRPCGENNIKEYVKRIMCQVVNLAWRKAPVFGLREHGMKLRVTAEVGGGEFLNFFAVMVICRKNRPVVSLRNGMTSQVGITSPSSLSFFYWTLLPKL